ncbi:hypothetical protein HN51_032884 [Arachis hypogaea]
MLLMTDFELECNEKRRPDEPDRTPAANVEDELLYLKEEFTLLEPNKNGTISLENIKATSMKNATNAMESHILDFFGSIS